MVLKKTILFLCGFSLLYGTVSPAEQVKTQAPHLPAVTVHAVTVATQEIPSQIEVVGTVQAAERAAIAAKVTGTITELPVVPGSRVKKNDLLVKISAEEISARMLQARAQLAQARRNLEREQSLLKRQATTSETVKSMHDMFAVAEAGYREAQTMLGYTTITAPFDGVVTRKLANTGDLATPGTPLLQMENNLKLQVVSAVPESLAGRVHIGDKLPVRVPAAVFTATGTVSEIAPTADPLSRTTPVKINIDQTPKLRTGQFARVMLPGTASTSILVPDSAIVSLGQMNKVFVVHEDMARLLLVRTGSRNKGRVEILAGLNPGDRVIIDNNLHLVNGQPVTVTP